MGRNTSQESKAVEEGINHSMKIKGPVTPSEGEGSGIALDVSNEPHLKGSNEEARVTPEVPDGQGDDSSSSSSEISVEEISSDDGEVPINDVDMSMQAEDATDTTVIATDSIVKVTKNDNAVTLTSKNVKMTDVEMVTDQQVTEEQIPKQHNVPANVDAHIPPAGDAQAYDLLFRMMNKAKTFKRHPKHKALYDALAASLIVNEDDMDRVFGKSHPRNNHDKYHPPDVDSKKKRQRDDTDNDPSTNPNWSKEPSATAGPEQTLFIDLEKNAKDPIDFYDILGTTFDLSNYVKHRLHKDTFAKVDVKGPVYQLLKETCRSCLNRSTT
nr:hypothetical protein [Tanacetum cinerariifolium]